jgi:hypothetical protein
VQTHIEEYPLSKVQVSSLKFDQTNPNKPTREQTNRICYGVEIDPHYVDVAVKRWEAYTGKSGQKVQ